jgi:hypothetical protein
MHRSAATLARRHVYFKTDTGQKANCRIQYFPVRDLRQATGEYNYPPLGLLVTCRINLGQGPRRPNRLEIRFKLGKSE